MMLDAHLWNRLLAAIEEQGGDAMSLVALAHDATGDAIKAVAKAIIDAPASWEPNLIEMVEGGRYNLQPWFDWVDERPKYISMFGQRPHWPNRNVALEAPPSHTNLRELYETVGPRLADFSDILGYGIRTPEFGRSDRAVVLWRHDSQWCKVSVVQDGKARCIMVSYPPEEAKLGKHDKLLMLV